VQEEWVGEVAAESAGLHEVVVADCGCCKMIVRLKIHKPAWVLGGLGSEG